MSARPMTDGERVRILQWAQRFADDCAAPGSTPPLHASGDAMLDVCLALLSTSAAVRGMTALDRLRAGGWSVAVHNDYRINGAAATFWLFTHPNGRWAKGEGATDAEALEQVESAALSGIEGEDEQARPSGSAPISTDTKGTTK